MNQEFGMVSFRPGTWAGGLFEAAEWRLPWRVMCGKGKDRPEPGCRAVTAMLAAALLELPLEWAWAGELAAGAGWEAGLGCFGVWLHRLGAAGSRFWAMEEFVL